MSSHPNEPPIVNGTSGLRSPSYGYTPLPHSHHSSINCQTAQPPSRISGARASPLPSDFMYDEFEETRRWRVGRKTFYPKYICRALVILLILIVFVASLPIAAIIYHDRPPSDITAGVQCKTCKVLCKQKGAWLCEKAGCMALALEHMEGCFPVNIPKGWDGPH